MGMSSIIKRLYTTKLSPANVRQLTLPAGAAVTTTADAAGSTYGVWEDIQLLAGITADTLIVGVVLSAPSVTDVFTIDIGSCAGYANAAALNGGGAPAIAAAHRAEVRVDHTIVVITAVGEYGWLGGFVPLTFPIAIPNGVGIVGRSYGITAVAVTIDVSVVCVQGF